MLNMRPAGIQASILIKVSMSNADGTKAAGLVKSAETKAIHEPRLFRGFKYVIENRQAYQDFESTVKQYLENFKCDSSGSAGVTGLLRPDSGSIVERIFQQNGLFPAGADRNQNDLSIQKLLDTLNVFLRGCRQLGKRPHCG